ncbi:DUF4136 domain-containing protein [Hydrogenophaga sp. ZJX-1]|uniref:DUF4136 domain-containing protein n=1 Tax=Hydrogenophaga sp. ZJX-1 TaxID=3404778 RepID=UPI003B27D466
MHLTHLPVPQRIALHWRGLLAALSVLALGGCASVYRVDNAVESFPRWSEATVTGQAPAAVPTAPQSYRFDRLPSQTRGQAAADQDQLEQLARAALGQVGWQLAEPGAPARWTVQVGAATLRLPYAPWESPWDRRWGGFGLMGRDYVVTGSGHVIWTPMFMPMDWPYYQRKVSLLIRQAGSGEVVYETHAAHDGRWNSSPELWRAMLDAALQGFPTPPAGTRQVNVDLPR